MPGRWNVLIPAFDAGDTPRRLADLTGCALLGPISWTASLADRRSLSEAGVAGRSRWRAGVRTRDEIAAVLAESGGRVVIEADTDPAELIGLPIARLIVRIGPDFRDAVDAIVRFRPFVGGFELVWSDDTTTTRSFATRRGLRRLAGDCDLAIEDPTADAATITALDAIGIDVIRPAGFGAANPDVMDSTDPIDPIGVIGTLMRSTRTDGRWPTVICDEAGRALSLVASSPRSLRRTVMVGQASFERTEGVHAPGLAFEAPWRPVAIEIDVDRTAIRMVVAPESQASPTAASSASGAMLGWSGASFGAGDRVRPIARTNGLADTRADDRTDDRLIGGHRDGPATLADLARSRRGRVPLAG
jgi:hypothetical protein